MLDAELAPLRHGPIQAQFGPPRAGARPPDPHFQISHRPPIGQARGAAQQLPHPLEALVARK